MLLDGEGRAEGRPVVGAGGADVVHDLVRDPGALAAPGRDGEPHELEVGSAPDPNRVGLGIHVDGDAVEGDRAELEEWAGRLGEPHPDPGHEEGGRDVEVVGVRAGEHEDGQARLRAVGDPRGVDLEGHGDARGREGELLARGEGDVEAYLFAPTGQVLGRERDGHRVVDRHPEGAGRGAAVRRIRRTVPEKDLEPVEQGVGVAQVADQRRVHLAPSPGEQDPLEHPRGAVRYDGAELFGEDTGGQVEGHGEHSRREACRRPVLPRLDAGRAVDGADLRHSAVDRPSDLDGLGAGVV